MNLLILSVSDDSEPKLFDALGRDQVSSSNGSNERCRPLWALFNSALLIIIGKRLICGYTAIYSIHSISSGKRISYESKWRDGIASLVTGASVIRFVIHTLPYCSSVSFTNRILTVWRLIPAGKFIFAFPGTARIFLPELLFVIYKNPHNASLPVVQYSVPPFPR